MRFKKYLIFCFLLICGACKPQPPKPLDKKLIGSWTTEKPGEPDLANKVVFVLTISSDRKMLHDITTSGKTERNELTCWTSNDTLFSNEHKGSYVHWSVYSIEGDELTMNDQGVIVFYYRKR